MILEMTNKLEALKINRPFFKNIISSTGFFIQETLVS